MMATKAERRQHHQDAQAQNKCASCKLLPMFDCGFHRVRVTQNIHNYIVTIRCPGWHTEAAPRRERE